MAKSPVLDILYVNKMKKKKGFEVGFVLNMNMFLKNECISNASFAYSIIIFMKTFNTKYVCNS